ncbi:MAG: galactokinase, partial [Planctomycetia bacterium]|nr:galactokinase [Planctomycetia bacterium]
MNLIGEHTDYNDGFVLPMAIGPCIRVRVTPRADRRALLHSEHGPPASLDLERPLQPGDRGWSCYPAGVIAQFQRLGWSIPGFEATISADLPAGGGLSSSAALEVATATAVEMLCGQALPPEEKALLCQQAEHEFADVPCGIMDQFAVTCCRAGHALLLDCRSRILRHVPFAAADVRVLVIDSGVRHRLADGEYARRRAECASAARHLRVPSLRDVDASDWQTAQAALPEPERSRTAHVISENDRTLAFADA